MNVSMEDHPAACQQPKVFSRSSPEVDVEGNSIQSTWLKIGFTGLKRDKHVRNKLRLCKNRMGDERSHTRDRGRLCLKSVQTPESRGHR